MGFQGNRLKKKADRIYNNTRQLLVVQNQIVESLSGQGQIHKDITEVLKGYKALDNGKPMKLERHGRNHDGGYVIPIKAFEEADILIGYGIADDNSFKDNFSIQYSKPSYGFDCGIASISSKSPLFTFVKECIGSDKVLYENQKSSGQVSSFSQQLKKFN